MTLGQWLRSRKEDVSVKLVARIACRLLMTLRGIHEQHVIHYDIHPDNIAVNISAREDLYSIYLIDFSAARCTVTTKRPYLIPEGFGNVAYASMRSHLRCIECRRVDHLQD